MQLHIIEFQLASLPAAAAAGRNERMRDTQFSQ